MNSASWTHRWPIRGSPRPDAGWLEAISAALPLTYAYDALERAGGTGSLGAGFAVDLAIVVGGILLALALGAATLRRRTA